ncbi:30S ribosomal protein S20 [Eubacteriales bacterium OttesenSCG-928-M02]|nr:30S ribosomal protein S20 [Eubacteriales bacterium OttesenSCG-928-M02]
MANIKSAKKRVLVNEKKAMRNRIVKSRMKTSIKKFETAVQEGAKDEATTLYREAVRMVDKAASKGVIHKNMSNRKKAQLTKAYAALG